MVHIIVVTHGALAEELVRLSQNIVGARSDVSAVCLEMQEGTEDLRGKVLAVLQAHRATAEGFLVLVDMFGGTPSNVSLELAQHHPLKVVTGVNLPLLLEAITHRATLSLDALANLTFQKGRQSIFNANDLFSGPGPRED